MNELIQALGTYTEALENKIAALEERSRNYEEKIAALEERVQELADSLINVRSNSSPSETDAPCVAPPTPTDPSAGTQLFLRDSISAPLASGDAGCPQEPELALEPEIPEETKKVDIRQMISLGDRFLFQRELFGQNGEKMQRSLDEINQCATEQEALDYVERHFEWDKKSPTYELFINAIHRSHSGR